MDDRLVVVARYEENLEWLEDLHNPFVVYNKGSEWSYNIARKDVPNKGREAETYIRSIIENYSKLDQYKYMVFLQGNPFDHCYDAYSKINSHDDEDKFGCVADYNGLVQLDKILYLRDHSVSLIDCLLNQSYLNQSGAIKLLILLNFIGIKMQSCQWNYACGAQYIVPTKMLLNKSIDWWMHFYRVFECYSASGPNDFAYILELSWPIIWDYSDKLKVESS